MQGFGVQTVGSLGTTDGDTFLGELLPVPRPGMPRAKKNGQRSKRPPSYPVSRFGFRGETAYHHRAALGRNPAGPRESRWHSGDRQMAGAP
jgi:hypothetical protein